MALQKIALIITKKSAVEVKNILYKFSAKIPQIDITKRLSDDEIEIEFKVPFEASEKIVKEFIKSGFSVKPIDANIKKILFQSEHEIKVSYAAPGFVLPDNIFEGNENSKQSKELSDFVSSYLNGKIKLTTKNKVLLKNSINFYIDKLRKEAYFNKSKVDENINELLDIASNKKLKTSTFFDISKNAGLTAITISAERSQNIGELINICNNRNLHCLVNAKAAAKFAEIVFQDEKLYETDISIALKRLNSRWLLTIADAAENDLSDNEKFNFNKLKSFIKKKSF